MNPYLGSPYVNDVVIGNVSGKQGLGENHFTREWRARLLSEVGHQTQKNLYDEGSLMANTSFALDRL
jgi:hypothetical protein